MMGVDAGESANEDRGDLFAVYFAVASNLVLQRHPNEKMNVNLEAQLI